MSRSKEKDEFVDVVAECAGDARAGKVNKSKVSMVLGALKGAAQVAKNGQTLVEAVTKGFDMLTNLPTP